jgi:hypothetical protein
VRAALLTPMFRSDIRLKLEDTLLDQSWPLNRVVVDHSLDAQLRRISPEQERWMDDIEAREEAHDEAQKRTAAEGNLTRSPVR